MTGGCKMFFLLILHFEGNLKFAENKDSLTTSSLCYYDHYHFANFSLKNPQYCKMLKNLLLLIKKKDRHGITWQWKSLNKLHCWLDMISLRIGRFSLDNNVSGFY